MNLGATNIATLKLGSQQVNRVMLGSVEVWANMDADAAAYIAAVETALGSSISSTQAEAINAFIVAEKAASRWSAIKRFYLPIWGNESANAIDMVTLGSGSFVGAVTYAAGYVQGDGTSGYFNTGVTPDGIGLSKDSEFFGGLCFLPPTAASRFISAQTATVAIAIDHFATTIPASSRSSTNANFALSLANQNGLFVSIRDTAATHNLYRRTTSDFSASADKTGTASGGIAHNIVVMARNVGGSISSYSNGRYGLYFMGHGLARSSAANFTSSLKTLWETCTGLTLP
jgi:hypothetical protein